MIPQREIKFRAWYNDDKKMMRVVQLESKLNRIPNYVYGCEWDDEGEWDSSEDFILMQYIELKDKNGKEIFQEDLVKKDGDDKVYIASLGLDGPKPFHVDIFRSDERGFNTSIDFFPIKMPEGICKFWEVIGNVYENKNLLK